MQLGIKALVLFFACSLVTAEVYASTKVIDVTFTNNSDDLLKCSSVQGKTYTPFLRLKADTSKSFSKFKNNASVRCSIAITNSSTTLLTYFKVKAPGEYQLLKEYVKCTKDCRNSKTRWAAIVVDPSGKPYYTIYK